MRKKIRQRIRVYISGHKAIRLAFPNSTNSQEAALQKDGDVAMSGGRQSNVLCKESRGA